MHVVIAVNATKPITIEKAHELKQWLQGGGISADIVDADGIVVKGAIPDDIKEKVEDATLYCSLGGDGTLLSCAQLVFRHPAPVLGFNFGHLGFLNGATPEVMIEGVKAALDGKLEEEHRCALDVVLETRDDECLTYTLLNEVAITRGMTGKMIDYDIMIDGELLSTIRADGAIVASPTGSTAYSLSAGGPLISPTLSCMVVSALAPHSLISRAMVVDQSQIVSILPTDKSNLDCSVFADGHLVELDRSPRRVVVTVQNDAITLLKYNVPGFTRSASKAFFGGTE